MKIWITLLNYGRMMWKISLDFVNKEVDNGRALLCSWEKTWMAKEMLGLRYHKSMRWNLIPPHGDIIVHHNIITNIP